MGSQVGASAPDAQIGATNDAEAEMMQKSFGIILLVAITACGPDGSHDQDRIDERETAGPALDSRDALDPDAGSCVAQENRFGLAVIRLTGVITEERRDDAYFGLTPDSTSFYLMITEQEIGHFEMVFETPRQPEYPEPERYALGTDGAGPITGFTAGLQLFLEDDYVELAPREGGLTIERADSTGVCGTLDVVWVSPEIDSVMLITTGEFQAVLNRYSAAAQRRQ